MGLFSKKENLFDEIKYPLNIAENAEISGALLHQLR